MANLQDRDNIFGLKKGMNKSEVEKLGFGLILPDSGNNDNDSFRVTDPQNIPQSPNHLDLTIVPPHLSFFENGLISFSVVWEIRGFDITAEGAKREMNEKVQKTYEKLREILMKQYGQGSERPVIGTAGGCYQVKFPPSNLLNQVRIETHMAYDESYTTVSLTYDFADMQDYLKKKQAYEDSLF